MTESKKLRFSRVAFALLLTILLCVVLMPGRASAEDFDTPRELEVLAEAPATLGAVGLQEISDTKTVYVGVIESLYSAEEPAAEPTQDAGSDTITVYFIDTKEFGNLNVYCWSDGGGIPYEWPGISMTNSGTNEDGYTIYRATIPDNMSSIVFNGNGRQTVDITEGVADGVTWYALEGQDFRGCYMVQILEPTVEPSTVPYHVLTIDTGITHGTVTATVYDTQILSKYDFMEVEDPVTLTVVPDTGYEINSVSYNDGSEHIITPTNGGYSFTMPDADVTVSAEFTPVSYAITLSQTSNGSISASMDGRPADSAHYKDPITLTLTPDEGYTMVDCSLEVTYPGSEYTEYIYPEQGIGNNSDKWTFTMPAADVTVTAEFGKDLATCTATVPNPLYQSTDYYIGWLYELDDHGGIQVTDSEGNSLTYGSDYWCSNVVTLEPGKYEEGGVWYNSVQCSNKGEKCQLTLAGCGDWAGTISTEIVILSPTGNGEWGDLSWSFENGTLSINAKNDAVTPVTMNAADTYSDYPWYDYSSNITEITIGESVASVADWAFGGTQNVNPYSGVTSVTLPSTLTDIGADAFAYMGSLETIDLTHVLTIGDYAFNQCASLTVSVPATVNVIGGGAFFGCRSVSAPAFGTPTFIMPDDTDVVGVSAFENDVLITVVDASSCSSISADAFKGCTGLRRIRLPKDCDINSTAFTGCGTIFVYAPSGGATQKSCENNNNCTFVAENPNS